MSLATLEPFLMWCTIVGFGTYVLTAGSLFAFRGLVLSVHEKFFRMGPDAVDPAMHRFLGNFKLLLIVFFLVPWIATLIIR